MKNIGTKMALIALVVSTIGCDRITKRIAADRLVGMPTQSYLADTLRLEYAENAGAFLSLGANWPSWARQTFFAAGPGVMLVVVAFAAVRQRWVGQALVGAALFWTGGLSNLLDRVTRGSVVDFLNVGVGPVRSGIFNVADLAITLGIVLLATAHRGTKQPVANAPVSPPSEASR